MQDPDAAAAKGAGVDGGRLLRLAAACPGCGTRPAVRVTAEAVRDVAHEPPEARLATYQCQRRRCGAIFDLPARAFQQAS